MNNKQIAKIVTDQIIKLLEAGKLAWQVTWMGSMPKNLSTKKQYHGFNILVLNAMMARFEYTHNLWITFNQAKKMGGKVKKGSHGAQVIYWNFRVLDEDSGKFLTDKQIKDRHIDVRNLPDGFKVIPFLRYSTVFNVDQVEGIEVPEALLPNKNNDKLACAEEVIANYPGSPTIKFGGSQPCYRPKADEVFIPDINHFDTADNYYSTMFHELVHSTGHEKRINREELKKYSGLDQTDRSKEELIAELGASFLNAHCGIKSTLNNNAAYCQSWLKPLHDDPQMLISAAAKAEAAMNWILGSK